MIEKIPQLLKTEKHLYYCGFILNWIGLGLLQLLVIGLEHCSVLNLSLSEV
jgi:hypothetical protein